MLNLGAGPGILISALHVSPHLILSVVLKYVHSVFSKRSHLGTIKGIGKGSYGKMFGWGRQAKGNAGDDAFRFYMFQNSPLCGDGNLLLLTKQI